MNKYVCYVIPFYTEISPPWISDTPYASILSEIFILTNYKNTYRYIRVLVYE